jgi:hypothetical protein
MEHMQSLSKARIKNAQYVQKMNYSTWSLKRRARADLLKKNDWVLMKRPGSIRVARLTWEGPYIFKGYRDQETKQKAVLQDNKGHKWYRASNQVRKYYPWLDFTKLYMNRIKEIDDREPTGKEIEMRFVEEAYNASSFVTLRIAEQLTRIRKAVDFLPAAKTPRFNL